MDSMDRPATSTGKKRSQIAEQKLKRLFETDDSYGSGAFAPSEEWMALYDHLRSMYLLPPRFERKG